MKCPFKGGVSVSHGLVGNQRVFSVAYSQYKGDAGDRLGCDRPGGSVTTSCPSSKVRHLKSRLQVDG